MRTPVKRLPPLAAVLLLPALACVMPDQLSQLQKDVADIRQQIRRIERDQSEARELIDLLEQEAERAATEGSRGSGGADVADLNVEIDQLRRRIDRNGERMNELTDRLEHFAQPGLDDYGWNRTPPAWQTDRGGYDRPAEPPEDPLDPGDDGDVVVVQPPEEHPVKPKAGPPSAGGAVPDPETLYNTAYTDYNKGNYALAVGGFEEYQRLFPDSALADNAMYWIGECLFSQGEYGDALDAFDNLLGRYPRTDKAAAANLKKALAYLERNQVGTAIYQLKFVGENYPGTDEARIARDRLAGLGQ